MDVRDMHDAELCAKVEALPLGLYPQVAELLRRFNEQGLQLVAVRSAVKTLEGKLPGYREAILDEVADELEGRRKGGFWAIGDAHGNHVRDQSFIRAVGAVKELKAKGHG